MFSARNKERKNHWSDVHCRSVVIKRKIKYEEKIHNDY